MLSKTKFSGMRRSGTDRKMTERDRKRTSPRMSVTRQTPTKCARSGTTHWIQVFQTMSKRRTSATSKQHASVPCISRPVSVGQSSEQRDTQTVFTTSRTSSKAVAATHSTEMTGVHRRKNAILEVQKNGRQQSMICSS